MSDDAIAEGLTRAADGEWTVSRDLQVRDHVPYVIFSDQHKGSGDKADEFRENAPTYEAALKHYRDAGHTLVLLGDCEELWENSPKEVFGRYGDLLKLEASFGAERYLRVWGNHDDRWMGLQTVDEELSPYLPQPHAPGVRSVHEAVRIDVRDGDAQLGTLLLLHGHQGTFASDKVSGWSRRFVRFYRFLQNTLHVCWWGGCATPAKDVCLRGEHDRQMYAWAEGRAGTILIAGHTHRPVWAGKTHLQQLMEQLAALEVRAAAGEPGARELVESTRDEIAVRMREVGSCQDAPALYAAYFNTGCCKFKNGGITGIEIEEGYLRLIKWDKASPANGHRATRVVLEQAPLEFLFKSLKP